jgi:hypothetical protein
MDLMALALKRMGIKDHSTEVLAVKKVELQFEDGKVVTIKPKIKGVTSHEGNANGQHIRVIGIDVFEWYDDGEQPPT